MNLRERAPTIAARRTMAQPLRVLFVHRWGAVMAGGEVWIRNLAEYLRSEDVEVLAALQIRGPLHAALAELQVPTRMLGLGFLRGQPRTALLSSGVDLAWSAIRLARVARRDGIHVLHAFSPESAEVAYLASRLVRRPLVVTVMNCGPYPKLDAAVLRRAERVIGVSGAVEQDLVGLGVPRDRVVRIPSGIAFDRLPRGSTGRLRRELGVAAETPLVGIVATLERKKAQDTLIRAVPRILQVRPDAEFVLIGADHESAPGSPGPYEAELRALARSCGVADRVHLTGFRPNAVELIGELNVSVLCSRKEALGLAAVESIALGVPVVATAVEGLREVVEDGVTGLLVPPDDPIALADAIGRVLVDGDLARRLSEAGRHTMRERFDACSLASRHRELYDELMNSQESDVEVH